MFTGIIQAVGQLLAMDKKTSDCRLTVHLDALARETIALGDSIAVNGVCLTAVTLDGGSFSADVSNETLAKTSLGHLKVGDRVNLELAMQVGGRLGGHIVSGHVDGVGEVLDRTPDGASERFRVRAPDALAKYIAEKGSITIDGTSLTVNGVDGSIFDVNIVPHTIAHTIIGQYQSGTAVNLEVDVIARYLERLLSADSTKPSSHVDMDLLARTGFLDRKA